MSAITRLVAGLAVGAGLVGCTRVPPPAPVPAEATAPRPTVDNPTYLAWAKFPAGTAVTHRATTAEDGLPQQTVTTTRYRLAAKADDELTVEMQATTVRFDGNRTENPPEVFKHPRRIVLPPGKTPETFGQPPAGERGEEVLTVAGTEYKAIWLKLKGSNEAGEVLSQTWTSEAVPGRLVRSVGRTAAIGKTVTIELIAVERPAG